MLPSLETDRLLDETEASKILSIKVSTLRRWRWKGEGPRFHKIGAAVRYDPQTLQAYIDDRERTSTSDPGSQAA